MPVQSKTAWRWVAAAVLCLFVANVWRVEADADLWGHLQFGLESLAARKLATTDPYSYTASGAAWTNHEWLSELALAGGYRLAGVPGLVLLRAILLALTFTALAILVRRRNLAPAPTLALALFMITFLPEFYRLRPQMFTYTAFAWLIVICDQHAAGRRWGLVALPWLMVVWCNCHAGFVAGLGVFGIYACLFAWQARNLPNRRQEWCFLAAAMLACILATLCNPYGFRYWRYVLFAITMPRPAITEWGPVWNHHPVVLACYLTAVLIPAIAWAGSRRQGALAETAAFALVAYLAGAHARHLPFVMILGAAVFIRRWPEFAQTASHFFQARPVTMPLASFRGFAFSLLVLLASLGGASKLTREVAACQSEGVLAVQADLYPVDAVSFLAEQHIEGNLYCGFNWGEYCLWHLAPGSRVFCDGRYETVYSADVARLALGPLVTEEDRLAILERYPTEMLLVPSAAPLADWLAARDDLALVYDDGVAKLFLKRIAKYDPWLSRLAETRPPASTSAAGRHVPFPG